MEVRLLQARRLLFTFLLFQEVYWQVFQASETQDFCQTPQCPFRQRATEGQAAGLKRRPKITSSIGKDNQLALKLL